MDVKKIEARLYRLDFHIQMLEEFLSFFSLEKLSAITKLFSWIERSGFTVKGK